MPLQTDIPALYWILLLKAGFKLIALKMTRLTPEKAGEFYAVHSHRPFYGELVEFMSRGPILAAILEKDNAVADFRKLIGATDPAKADKGTIRQLFAASLGENAIHGSDSDENAGIESDFFFSISGKNLISGQFMTSFENLML